MRLIALCALAAATAALAFAASALSRTSAGLPPAEKHLDLVAFPGYAEAGGDDPRVNWVTPFVQTTGCKVHVRTVRSSTELLDAVAHGRYDGVAAFGDVTQVLTGGGEVQPIDTVADPELRRRLPGAEAACRRTSSGGRVVGIPHGRGADVLLWRTDLVQPAPDGLGRALRAAATPGRVGVYDAAITLADAAIHLGFRNPYELDRTQFSPRRPRWPPSRSADVGVYWQDLTSALADYTGGNAIVGEVTPAARGAAPRRRGARRDRRARRRDRPLGLVDAALPRRASGLHVPLARLHPLGEGERRLGEVPPRGARHPDGVRVHGLRAPSHAADEALVVAALVLADAAEGLPRRTRRRLRRLVRLVGRLGADARRLKCLQSGCGT